MLRRIAVMLLIALALAASIGHSTVSTAAERLQSETSLSVDSEQLLTDVLGGSNAALATVSPDGAMIAWGRNSGSRRNPVRELCLYTFANANQSCNQLSDQFEGFPYQLAWSPDSSQIAFTENPIQLGNESDIWLFDIAEAGFTNLTDDGVEGPYASIPPGSYALDYLPMWNAADGNLYFWRTEPLDNSEFSLTLNRLSVDGGEVEQLTDVTDTFGQRFVLFDYEKFYMDGVSAISPDGSKLMLILGSIDDLVSTPPTNGLWLLNLDDTTAAPQQLADTGDFQAALAGWQTLPAIPMGLSWTADSAGVAVVAIGRNSQVPMNLVYYVDAESGDMTPVVDFSQLEDDDVYFTPLAQSGLPPRIYSPFTVSLSAAGDQLLMYNNFSEPGLLVSPLPPDGSLPEANYKSQIANISSVTRTSRGSDGKILIYGLMLTTTEENTAQTEVEEPEPSSTTGVLTVEAESAVTEIIGERSAPLATLSPDGAFIAWGQQSGRLFRKSKELCLFAFESAGKSCFEVPDQFEGYPYQLAWSPDSSQIAFTENPLQLGDESDIWIFSAMDGSFANRTDDGVEGSFRAAEAGTYAVDYLPMWNAADGDLYFWRSESIELFDVTLNLYRLPAGGGEAELVRDVTEYFRMQLLAFDNEAFYMDGVSAISPDGTKIAMAVSSFQDVMNTPGNGLWILDLTDDTAPPQQLANIEDFQSALPAWQVMPASPMGLSWSSDSSRVVVIASSSDPSLLINLFYDFDVETGNMTPIVDFSANEDQEAFWTETLPNGLTLRYYSPWTGSMSPAGERLLMYNNLASLAGILESPLPPPDDLPGFIYRSQLLSQAASARSSRSSDGKVIMYGIMFTVSE